MKKKKTNNNAVTQFTKRMWGDTPVVDATQDLRIVLQPCDLEGAKTKDEQQCVFAKACRRSFGASKAMIWKSVAYVEMPMANGNKRVERYLLSKDVRKKIETFDRHGTMLPAGGFTLKAVPFKKTLEQQSKYLKAHREERKRHMSLFGTAPEVVTRGEIAKSRKTVRKIDFSVRRGTGKTNWTQGRQR